MGISPTCSTENKQLSNEPHVQLFNDQFADTDKGNLNKNQNSIKKDSFSGKKGVVQVYIPGIYSKQFVIKYPEPGKSGTIEIKLKSTQNSEQKGNKPNIVLNATEEISNEVIKLKLKNAVNCKLCSTGNIFTKKKNVNQKNKTSFKHFKCKKKVKKNVKKNKKTNKNKKSKKKNVKKHKKPNKNKKNNKKKVKKNKKANKNKKNKKNNVKKKKKNNKNKKNNKKNVKKNKKTNKNKKNNKKNVKQNKKTNKNK